MQRRFLLDNDTSNIVHSKLLDGVEWEALLDETVRECAQEVTTYLLCSNAGTTYYPTGSGAVDSRAPRLRSMIERGEDPFGDLLRGFKASGRETLITMRMNDVHNPTDGDAWNTPRIRLEHPDFVVGWDEIQAGGTDWMSYCLDYSRPEVQEYSLSLIAEMADRYGDVIDGIQLDWMRFPRHLPGPREEVWEKREALTQFTARARAILRQRRIDLQLAARVPPDVQGCRHLGMDLPEWTHRELVDWLVLCPFLTTTWYIPFTSFRSWLGEHQVPLYGGFDFNYGPAIHHPESLRGICSSLYDAGADGIYVFNFPCWTEYVAAIPYHWLQGLDDPRTAARKPFQVSVAHNRHRQTGIDGTGELPADLAAGGSLELSLYVPASALPTWRAILLVHSEGDVRVAINGTPAVPLRLNAEGRSESEGHRSEIFVEFVNRRDEKRRPDARDCRLFRAPAEGLRAGSNMVTIANASEKDLLIQRVNLGLW
jgi:hypothetical protein